MTPVADLTRAWSGLGLIVAGKREASAFFTATPAGLVVALGWFVLALILTAAAQSVAVGMPELTQVLSGFAIHAVTLATLAIVTALSLTFLKLDVRLLQLLVPIVYFMGLLQILSIPLVLLGPNVQLIAVLALGALIWRTGVVLGGMRTGVAFSYALLCFMVLVAVPYSLYMLLLAIPSPA